MTEEGRMMRMVGSVTMADGKIEDDAQLRQLPHSHVLQEC